MRLENKITVVTGAGSGLGRAVAELFAREGATVLLIGRRREKLEETQTAIRNQGGRTEIAALDVSEPGAMQGAITQLVNKHGRVDVLVANAGIVVARVAALQTTEEDWEQTLKVNLTGVHRSCTAVLPHMVQQEGGAVVAVSSISGQIAVPMRASYSASKAGVIGYMRNIAVDYAHAGVRANCVCPAFVETDLTRTSLQQIQKDPQQWSALLAKHPLGLGTPEDVAHACLFLSCAESRWITGVDLSVDGGYTAL